MKPVPPVLSLHQLPLYNTGRMSSEQVIAAFAVRLPVFSRIMADLLAEQPQSRAQHHLIVGQRGMGKTMLLARIAAELRSGEPATRFLPLVFAEEQYAVDRLSKFWLNCLDSLADAREQAGDQEAADRIDRTIQNLKPNLTGTPDHDGPAADAALSAFLEAVQPSGQRPVLLVDNLQLVFERLGSGQQHSLRELLMRPGCPILIGASPSPPRESQDYGAAFYDHFKVHYLRPLDVKEMTDLLLHLATAFQRDDVHQRVQQHPARLQVLRQLTGGNPRTTVTLFFLYAEDFAPSVFSDLENLLDRVTPLYKARFEELTPQQQVIASAIAGHWDPVTGSRLAEMTSLPAGTVSAQLDRLEKSGFIEKVDLFGESRTGFQLAERFFNIWFLMRGASRRHRREVEFLTRFIESFYEAPDRTRLAQSLMSECRFSGDRNLLSRAVAASLDHAETAEDLTRHADLDALRQSAGEARRKLEELIDFNVLPPATLAFHDLRQKLISMVPADAGTTPEKFAEAVLGDRRLFAMKLRERLAGRSAKLTKQEIASFREIFLTNCEMDADTYSKEPVMWLFTRLSTGQLSSAEDIDDWNRAFIQAPDKESLELLMHTMPEDIGGQLSAKVINRIREEFEPSADDSGWHWFNWAYYFLSTFQRYSEAETAYRKAIVRAPENASSWNNLGNLLHVRLQRYTEAETAYREAIVRAPENATFRNNLGNLLQVHLQSYTEAETAYREAIACNPKLTKTWNRLGTLYLDYLHRFDDAAKAFAESLRLDPANETVHQNLLFLHRDFLGEGSDARALMDSMPAFTPQKFPETSQLQDALFAAYDANWGLACEALEAALEYIPSGFRSTSTGDWMRAGAVLLHLNYGAELLAFLEERGQDARLRPWYEALRALHLGDRRHLQNVAPEVRTIAEKFYDEMERRLIHLPEKTSRRPKAKPTKRSRTRA